VEIVDIWLRALLTVFSFFLFLIASIAYNREREQIFLAIAFIFMLFFIKGVVLTLGIFWGEVEHYTSLYRFDLIVDIIILSVLLFGSWGLRPHE